MFDDKAAKSLGKKKGQKSKEEVLEKARAERAERKRLREAGTYVIRLQKWVRGRTARSREWAAQRADLDTKLTTIATLKAALAAQGVTSFVPPAGSVFQLAGQLLFFYRPHNADDRARLNQVCDLFKDGLRTK
jgi:hypothetical protein